MHLCDPRLKQIVFRALEISPIDFGIPETDKFALVKSTDPEIIKKVMETASKYDMIITI